MLKFFVGTMAVGAALYLSAALAQPLLPRELQLASPEGSSVERLGDSMVVNGRSMVIDHVTTPRPPSEVLRHYRKALNEHSSGKIVENKLGADQILARKIGEHFVTVRVRAAPGGASDVWVMTTPMMPAAASSALPSHLALPAGSRVLSNVETVDGGRRAFTVTATAEAAVSATEDFLKRSMGERGFTLVTSDVSGKNPSRRMLLFQRGSEDVMVTIADGPAGRTMVMNASGPK